MATGKVEMELEEYDQMKSTLDMYQEIINTLTYPRISPYEINWYNDQDKATILISTEDIIDNISPKSRIFLENLIKSSIMDYLVSHDLEGKFELGIGITLGLLRKGDDSEKERY